jgi:D-alanyl-D-alanine carboxypeptidase
MPRRAAAAVFRTGFVLVALAALLSSGAAAAAASRQAAFVIDANTGEVFYAHNADKQNYPASLTKMMTLYLTFEALEAGRLSPDQKLTVSARAAAQPATKLGLAKGQSIAVKDAILGLVTRSANDAATVVAEALAGSEERFAVLMTAKAKMLGMSNTRFRNASGLPDSNQVSSARDMARLALALYRRFPQFYDFFSTERFTFRGATFRNHNRMLKNYVGTDGLKTGYTRASGFNITVSVQRGDRHLIGVVFGGTSASQRDQKMAALLDDGFAKLAARSDFAFSVVRPELKPALIELPAGALRPVSLGESDASPIQFALAERELPMAWGVQVGAYASPQSATHALEAAASVADHVLGPATSALMTVEQNGGTLYRARFVGLTESEAEEACRLLRRGNLPCAVVRHVSETSTALGS